MQQVWPIIRALPMVIALVALMGFAIQFVELWVTRNDVIGTGYAYPDADAAERVFLMAAFIRLVIDFVWNLGWAAVVYAAVLYVEGQVQREPEREDANG